MTSSSFDVESLPVSSLLRIYRSVLRELLRRGVVRTSNPPTGDLAELLIAKAFDGVLAPNSEKSFDVEASDGRRIQVKSRVLAGGLRRERQLSTIRTWDFTHLAVILFGPDYTIARASLMSVAVAQQAATEDRHVRGNRLMALDAFLDRPDIEDITDLVIAALDQLDAEHG